MPTTSPPSCASRRPADPGFFPTRSADDAPPPLASNRQAAGDSRRTPQRNYDLVASSYRATSHLYSGGKIRKSKLAQLKWMQEGDQVLFLGCGDGEEAVAAAQRGVRVTCVDLSQRMLDRLQHKLTSHGLSANLICADALELDPSKKFDAVATNYFLNVFSESDMRRMLAHAAELVKPGGRLLIADVAPPSGSWFGRAFNVVYFKLAMSIYWCLGLVAWHDSYHYPDYFDEVDLTLETIETFRLFRRGPVLYQTIVAVRSSRQNEAS